MAQKKISLNSIFDDFRVFGMETYILTTFFTRITKIRFFFASAQWLLSYEHIQKPEVQNGTVFSKSETCALFSN